MCVLSFFCDVPETKFLFVFITLKRRERGGASQRIRPWSSRMFKCRLVFRKLSRHLGMDMSLRRRVVNILFETHRERVSNCVLRPVNRERQTDRERGTPSLSHTVKSDTEENKA